MRPISAAFLATILVCAVFHAVTAFGTEPAETIAETLKQRFPGVRIDQVTPSRHLPGYFEVITATGIAYTDATADLLITGKLTDTRTQDDLTERRWSELHAIDMTSLPLDLAIKTVRGDGTRSLVIFADPDCPFCQKLEIDLQSLTNVTIYTFLYPLEGLHPDARRKAETIWCSRERTEAWTAWMVKRVPPKAESCSDNPIARILELGSRLKIEATPTMFLANGRRLEGALSAEALERAIIAGTTSR